jgi:hypothetical protein
MSKSLKLLGPGKRGGHGISPKREIIRCRNKRRKHSRVGRSTFLLKPQGTIVWWKIRGQKFTGHLCVTLRRDCVDADRLGLRLTDASTRGNVVRCANWVRPSRWLFTRDRAFFTPLPYPSTDHIWRWGFLLIPFTAKSALSHCDWPRFEKIVPQDTRSLTPQRSMLTKSEGHCLCSNTCTPRYHSGEARK